MGTFTGSQSNIHNLKNGLVNTTQKFGDQPNPTEKLSFIKDRFKILKNVFSIRFCLFLELQSIPGAETSGDLHKKRRSKTWDRFKTLLFC